MRDDPNLFHAFAYHYDAEELIVVEPVDTSEILQYSDANDTDERHRRIRANAARKLGGVKMVAYRHTAPAKMQSDSEEGQDPYHHVRRLLAGSRNTIAARSRQLGTPMAKQLRDTVSTYQGPYGTAAGCPARQQKVTMGVAVDAGFYAAVSGSSSSSSYADRVHAYVTNIINIANVIYADQINVFLVAGDYIMKTTAPNSATSWNQKPYAADRQEDQHGVIALLRPVPKGQPQWAGPQSSERHRSSVLWTHVWRLKCTDYSRLLDNFKIG